jgi:hypothetical protein
MSVKFSDKFGLPKDRLKLDAGFRNFEIFKIEIIKSKKLYDVREETEAGTKISKKLIDIAYIDAYECDDNGKPQKDKIIKYYAPNAPIVAACKDILTAFGKKDGMLTETVYIGEVATKDSEGKNAYLYFN